MAAPIGNKNAIGNKGGRPPFYETVEELQKGIDSYFEAEANKRTIHLKDGSSYDIPIHTICGLALHLGFSSRQSLLDYAEKIEFVDVIKKAKTKIEMIYEEGLHFGECAGKIFALKNMGWKDKTDHVIELDNNTDLSKLSTDELLKRADAIRLIKDKLSNE